MKIVQKANRQLRIQDDFLDKYLEEGYKLVEVAPEPPDGGPMADDPAKESAKPKSPTK